MVNDILSPEALKKAGDLEVFDENGAKIKFSTFHVDKKTLVIFIRHFLCGNCMEYVTALSAQIDPSELSAKGISVIIIGCGQYEMIKPYVKDTESKYPLYADPSQKLYDAFGLARTLAAGKKPEYMSFGLWGGVVKGISNGIKAGMNAFKAGDVKQVGGEFLLGPGDTCTWGHKMATTRDHTEIAELREVLNLDVKETKTTDGVEPTPSAETAPTPTV